MPIVQVDIPDLERIAHEHPDWREREAARRALAEVRREVERVTGRA